jgi:type II secretory pathway component GspD/PulD (secretin)
MKFVATVTQGLVSGVLVSLLACPPAWSQSLQVIDLQHRSAQEVIPVLQPLLEPGGALSGQDYQLFVRASSANVAQLRQALAQIDRAPRQLLVSVRRGTSQELERQALDGSVVVGSDGSRATVRATDSAAQRSGNGIASVQVLEGNSAFISIGSSVPIVTAVAAGGGRRPWVAGSTSYRDIGSGFTVTPRIIARIPGEQVVLDISQQSQQLNSNNRDIQTQSLSTQVTGRLGEWIQLGNVSESSSSTGSGILNRSYATRSDAQSVWVKVE